MKIIKTILAVLSLALPLCTYSTTKATGSLSQNETNMKSIIVYFTHSGNTELAAKNLAAVTGAPVIRLMPQKHYSAADVDWVNEQSRCTQEHLNQSLRPAIKPVDIDWNAVDTVFIGFPIWWHEEPAVIRTFLDNYKEQLRGKTLYPFCTSYESPMSEADATLRNGYADLNWKTGLRFPAKPEQIKKWIRQ